MTTPTRPLWRFELYNKGQALCYGDRVVMYYSPPGGGEHKEREEQETSDRAAMRAALNGYEPLMRAMREIVKEEGTYSADTQAWLWNRINAMKNIADKAITAADENTLRHVESAAAEPGRCGPTPGREAT